MGGRLAGKRGCACDETGQASLEYLLVGLVLMALIGAVGVLWQFASQGGMGALVGQSASHAATMAGGVADALMF